MERVRRPNGKRTSFSQASRPSGRDLGGAGVLAHAPPERADRASAGLAQPLSDEAVDARVLELRQRESDLDQREAEFEADVQFREDRIERWRTELEELEQTLDRRERDLVSYVDQLQGAMSNGDDAWWSRPAGGDGGVSRY